MAAGEIVELGAAHDVLERPQHAATRALLSHERV
jgi:ABC-type oligopeptide transport system ATPase subunit